MNPKTYTGIPESAPPAESGRRGAGGITTRNKQTNVQTITIYGASDDLIEIEGVIREEFNAYDEEENKLAFGDGTVLSVKYDDDGCWRINRVVEGTATYEKKEATDPDGDYTDRVTLTGDVKWVLYGKELARAK